MNFSPGPAQLPPAVLREIQAELLDVGTGTSVMCLSHRSPEFGAIFDSALAVLRRVLKLPDTHVLLFTHGGGHGQFAAVPLNLCPAGKESRADYIISGTWSRRAAAEASKYVTVRTAAEGDGTRLPRREEWDLDPQASYRYLCSNETVDGLEFTSLPAFDDDVPLVVDMSSDIASKPLEWSRVGVAFACAPKNIGHAGLTVVALRRSLLDGVGSTSCPGVLDWRINVESGGMWNTPPTFNIYSTGKVLSWIEEHGGVEEMEAQAIKKARALYSLIDASDGFYDTPCTVSADRSRMNVPFNVCGGDCEATDAFLCGAFVRNMVGFRTNTPFGHGRWLRASLYIATTVEQVEELVAFMTLFAEEWRSTRGDSRAGSSCHHRSPEMA